MKLWIVRHGDPDYEYDSLTEKGWREAKFLTEKLTKIPAAAYYVSPLGRAKDTAKGTLEQLGKEAVECPWLREFEAPIRRPDVADRPMIPWDWLPEDWTQDERMFDDQRWFQVPAFAEANVKKEYDWVTSQLDALLETHGYQRQGRYYKAVKANNDTIVLFCHFGLECVLLSHLLNISPVVLWHGMCAAPSSVTTLTTEERRPGIAYFRMSSFGDIGHLYAHGEAPSFAARFCECYDNEGQRHD